MRVLKIVNGRNVAAVVEADAAATAAAGSVAVERRNADFRREWRRSVFVGFSAANDVSDEDEDDQK